jgi:membrane-associated phospholipid phosphatase
MVEITFDYRLTLCYLLDILDLVLKFQHCALRQSKWLVAGSFAFAAIWKRDAEIMWALMGAVANTILSSILKKMFNHERPAPALRSDPGMPSSHAQSIFYAAVFLVLSGKHFKISLNQPYSYYFQYILLPTSKA